MNILIYNNLHETRNKLVEEIAFVNHTEFNSKPDMHTWSIAQVCHHLVLLEEAVIKIVSSGLKETDNSQQERQKIDFILLDRTKKFPAPKIVEPASEPFEIQQMIDLLHDSRKHLMTFLRTIEDISVLPEKAVDHHALGALYLDQWIELIYLHEQRHIEQIKEIKLLCKI